MNDPRTKRLRIVIIPHCCDCGGSLDFLLRLMGHESRIIRVHSEGLAAIREWNPDVVFCDLDLPGDKNGFQVAADLHSDETMTAVRLMAMKRFGTAPDDDDQIHQAGFECVLTKPVALDALTALVGGTI